MTAETIAMRNGIKVVVQTGFTHIHTEGDSKTLIQTVRGHIQLPWEIHVLVQDILAYIQLCNKIFIHQFLEKEIAQPIG